MNKIFSLPGIAMFAVCAIATAAPKPVPNNQPFGAAIDSAIAGSWRSEAHRARDVYRHPKETLTFFGLTANMTVIEMSPGGGWYTELLAPLYRNNGKLIGLVEDPDSVTNSETKAEYTRDNKGFADKLAGDAAHFGAVEMRKFSVEKTFLGQDGSVDAVLTFRNVHNYVMLKNDRAMFQAFFKVLKSGGVLGVTDHRAAIGADVDKVMRFGYLPEAYVVKLATDAGFVLAAKSEINANLKDTKNYARGVWALPPTLDTGGEDKSKYVAIGESDRMTLKFRKP